MALGWFCLAYLFCRLSFHPKRLKRVLDWMVRLRGAMVGGAMVGGAMVGGAMVGGAMDDDDDDDDGDS